MRFATLITAVFCLASCDRIDEPIPPRPVVDPVGGPRITTWDLENSALVAYVYNTASEEVMQVVERKIHPPVNGVSGGSGAMRKVLLEDFTGHRCNNCPAAANTASQLQAMYPDQVVVVGIHVTDQFAAPLPNDPNGGFTTDFRTEAGNAYEQAFNISWLPAGMVNRRTFDSSRLLSHSAWPIRVDEMIGLTSPFDIWFSRLEFDDATNRLHAEVKVAVLEEVSGAHGLIIYLTEDHVIDWQIDAQSTPSYVSDYEHRHVLRTNLNGTWGAPVVSGTALAGDTITLSYMDIPL